MNARLFNLLCVAIVVAVGAAAIVMVQSGPDGGHFSLDGIGSPLPQLDLGLSLVILFDFGLMITALVWVFKDGPEQGPPE